jgi:hypothetical protein
MHKMKRISNSTLGIIGVIGSPWMLIDFMENGIYDRFASTSKSGLHGFLFITGWMCSVLGLFKLKAAGANSWGRTLLLVQLLFLVLANCWNVYEIIYPEGKVRLFIVLSHFWTVSAYFMLVTGTAIILAKKLQGWKRFIPLLAGLWFPIAFHLLPGIFGLTLITLVLSGVYSTIVFMLLGFSVSTTSHDPLLKRRTSA